MVDTDTGTLYIDAVTHLTAEQLPSACELAIANKELAIYDLSTQTCININERDVNLALATWVAPQLSDVESAAYLRLLQTYIAPSYT